MGRLEDKVAIVAGGGNGIGAAVCQRLDAEGARVVVADLDLSAAQSVSKQLKASIARQVDVSNEAQVEALLKQAIQWAGVVDIYVNSAVQWIFGSVDTVSDADWDKALSVNVKGYALGTKHASLAMSQQVKQSSDSTANTKKVDAWPYSILNIASVMGYRGAPELAVYTATKGAIIQLTKSSACDLAKHRIRVNCICPGPISTEAINKHIESIGLTQDDALKNMASHLIMARVGKPVEVAAAAAFLLSDDASYITGTMLAVDGGFLAV